MPFNFIILLKFVENFQSTLCRTTRFWRASRYGFPCLSWQINFQFIITSFWIVFSSPRLSSPQAAARSDLYKGQFFLSCFQTFVNYWTLFFSQNRACLIFIRVSLREQKKTSPVSQKFPLFFYLNETAQLIISFCEFRQLFWPSYKLWPLRK